MRSKKIRSKSPSIIGDEVESLISLLDNFLNPDLSQAEITQNAFSIQLNLAKLLSSFHFHRNKKLSKNVKKKNQKDNKSDNDDDDGEYKGESQVKRRKKNEIFSQKAQSEFAEKAIFIVNYYLDPSNNYDETEEISQNILTIMNFIPSLLQKIDSVDQVYIQKLTDQINTDSLSLFELQLPLLHSISEIMHGPQLSNLFQEKIKAYIKPDLSISSSLLNICIFNFGYQKNYQFQWAEIARKVFLSSNRQELLDSSLLLKSKRTCSIELCNMFCRVIREQNEKCDKLDFFLILILSSISSIATTKLLKHFTKYNRLNELAIKDCPIHIVPMNNIIDSLYTISSSRYNFIEKSQLITNLSRIISEIFICSENPEILTFALFNEDENKILLESTIEAITISSQEAPQLFISTFDSIGVLYTVSKQVSHQLIKPILKISCVFTQLFDSIVVYLKKLVNHPSGMMIAIDSLCSLLEDLNKQQQNQQQLPSSESGNETKKKKKQKRKAPNQTKSFNFEEQSNCIEMQLEVLKVIENIASTSPYLRSLVFRKLSEIVPSLSDRSKSEIKKIANEYKEESLNPDLFIDLITDQFDRSEESFTNFVFARDYPASVLQLLISLGDQPSDYFYFIDYKDNNFNFDFHFSLQLALRADIYSVLAPFNDDAFVAFSEYLKTIDFIASDEERKIISEWCSLKLDDSFVRRVIVEEQTNDSLLLYTVLRQLSTYSSSSLMTDKEVVCTLRKLFAETAECDFGVAKIPLKKHIVEDGILPKDAFDDDINQFREELTVQIAETASFDEEGFADFNPTYFVDEMKRVIMESAMTGRHCQAFFDIFEKFLPVSSDSSSKLFDLLASLKFDDSKVFSTIVDLLLSKSPNEDAFIASNLLLSCVKGEDNAVHVRKDSFKNAVMIRIAKFISSFANSEFTDEEFGQMMELLCSMMSFDNLNQTICQAIFNSVSVVVKTMSDNLNKDVEKGEEFLKFKEICDDWISNNKQKLGIRKCGVFKAFLQITENQINRMKRNKNGLNGGNDDDDDDYEEEDDDDENGSRMKDYTAEFDTLFELLQKEENDKENGENNNNNEDDQINIDELLMKNGIDAPKKKKKKKSMKRLPQFVPRKWRSQSKWIDEGLKEVSDSDDNFADLEDFVVENSPPQSSYGEEEDSNS